MVIQVKVPEFIARQHPIEVWVEAAAEQSDPAHIYWRENGAARGRPGVCNPGISGVKAHPGPDMTVEVCAPGVAAGAQAVKVRVFIEDEQKFRCKVFENALVDGKWKRTLIKTVLPVDDFTPFWPDEARWFEFEYLDGAA